MHQVKTHKNATLGRLHLVCFFVREVTNWGCARVTRIIHRQRACPWVGSDKTHLLDRVGKRGCELLARPTAWLVSVLLL